MRLSLETRRQRIVLLADQLLRIPSYPPEPSGRLHFGTTRRSNRSSVNLVVAGASAGSTNFVSYGSCRNQPRKPATATIEIGASSPVSVRYSTHVRIHKS